MGRDSRKTVKDSVVVFVLVLVVHKNTVRTGVRRKNIKNIINDSGSVSTIGRHIVILKTLVSLMVWWCLIECSCARNAD